MDLLILHRASQYLIAGLMYGCDTPGERCAVVSEIEFEWIRRFCPWIWERRSLSGDDRRAHEDVQRYLGTIFGR